MASKVDKDFNPSQFELDLKSIRDRFRQHGFLLAAIRETNLIFDEDSSYVDIIININEGQRIRVINFSITKKFLRYSKQRWVNHLMTMF